MTAIIIATIALGMAAKYVEFQLERHLAAEKSERWVPLETLHDEKYFNAERQ